MIEWLQEGIASYPGLFAACATSGIVFPVPEDVPALYAGMRIAGGQATWGPTLLVVTLGVLVRDLIAYAAGRLIGVWLLSRPFVIRFVGARRLQRAHTLVEDHGSGAILAGRFLVGMRAPIFLVAGAMGISARRFVAWDLVGLAVVIPVTLGLGYAFGQPLVDAAVHIVRETRSMAWILGAVITVVVLWRFRAQQDDAELATEPASPASEGHDNH